MNDQSHNINTEQLIVKLKGATRRSDEKVDGFEETVHSNHELLLPRHRVTREFLETEGLHDLPVECPEEGVPQILIGHDNQRVMQPLQVRKGSSPDFMAIRTPLG